jgi:hypothetical protein
LKQGAQDNGPHDVVLPAAPELGDATRIRALLDEQAAAWNRHDVARAIDLSIRNFGAQTGSSTFERFSGNGWEAGTIIELPSSRLPPEEDNDAESPGVSSASR